MTLQQTDEPGRRGVFGFSPRKKTSAMMKNSIEEIISGYVRPDTTEVLTVMRKVSSKMMVFDVISSEGRVPQFFPQGLRFNADAYDYVETLQTTVKS
ncbi:hypothetical protein ACTXT7_009041 [Hymenolepis weldensis]